MSHKARQTDTVLKRMTKYTNQRPAKEHI